MNSISAPPRILFIDDNVRNIGGHYLELASLLSDGAHELGYESTLATHHTFASAASIDGDDARLARLTVDPCFHVRRMEYWSLGVDGRSSVPRDLSGNPSSSSKTRDGVQVVRDRFCVSRRRPASMINTWAEGFVDAVTRFDPAEEDVIVINTGGDFQLIALAAALEKLVSTGMRQPLRIHVIFHFAVHETVVDERAIAFGQQVNAALAKMRSHRVDLHATTKALNDQLERVGVVSTAIPYPTRSREMTSKDRRSVETQKLLLAGMPRAEKGRGQIRNLLERLEKDHLRSGQFRWSMQLPRKRWKRMVPESLQAYCTEGGEETAISPIEVLRGNLSSEAYHDWLDTADAGLFLYEPDRYVARCSGVLLEMMVRGIPVIVPEGCWLSDMVRSCGNDGPVGWVYSSIDSLPSIIANIPKEIQFVAENCQTNASRIADLHSGRNTLIQMGIAPVVQGKTVEAA